MYSRRLPCTSMDFSGLFQVPQNPMEVTGTSHSIFTQEIREEGKVPSETRDFSALGRERTEMISKVLSVGSRVTHESHSLTLSSISEESENLCEQAENNVESACLPAQLLKDQISHGRLVFSYGKIVSSISFHILEKPCVASHRLYYLFYSLTSSKADIALC